MVQRIDINFNININLSRRSDHCLSAQSCWITRGGEKRIRNVIQTLTAGEDERNSEVNPIAIIHIEATVYLSYI